MCTCETGAGAQRERARVHERESEYARQHLQWKKIHMSRVFFSPALTIIQNRETDKTTRAPYNRNTDSFILFKIKSYIKTASQNGHFLYEVHFINIKVVWLHVYLNFGAEPTRQFTHCTPLQKG